MKKILLVSTDETLQNKLKQIISEKLSKPDIITSTEPETSLMIALNIEPDLFIVDSACLSKNSDDFFKTKNSSLATRKIPIVLIQREQIDDYTFDDIPNQIMSLIQYPVQENDIDDVLTIYNAIKSFHESNTAITDEQRFQQKIDEYLQENQAFIVNEIHIKDDSGRYQYKIVKNSKHYEQLMGIDLGNIHKNSLYDTIPGFDTNTQDIFKEVIQSQKVVRTQAFNDSNQRHLDILSFCSKNNRVTTFVKDITNSKAIEDKLAKAIEKAENSERLKNTFFANLSHEVRTPMNAIIGFSRLLDSDNLSKEKRSQYISIIQKSGFQLIETLDKLIDLSKIQSNQVTIINKSFYADKILEELQTFFKRKVFENEKDTKIQFVISENVRYSNTIVYSDYSYLLQILKEFVENAVKYTDCGCIEVGYEKNDNSITFFVKDTGIGIDKDQIDTIFSTFKQIDSHGFTKRGLGLGISISQKIASLLHGSIKVESKIGEGSTFYVEIPI